MQPTGFNIVDTQRCFRMCQ